MKTLSDHLVEHPQWRGRNVLDEKDVKQFIKDLKDNLCICQGENCCPACNEIDKLAGEKLT